jgi:hypothetical protein
VDGDDSSNQKRKIQIETPDGKRRRTDLWLTVCQVILRTCYA